MHCFGLERGGGGGISPNFVVVNAHRAVQCTCCAQFRPRAVELSAKRIVQGNWGFIQLEIILSMVILAARNDEQSDATMPF